jgi:Ca2+-binding EF-hand superfamily protein
MKPRYLIPIAAGLLIAACQTTKPNRFDQADLNSDGKLSRDEVHDYMVVSIFVTRDLNKDKLMTKEEWNEPADEKLFDLRDANKDGVVSLDEAKDYSKKAGMWDATIKEADADKDGSISREEAVAFYDSKAGPGH